MPNSRRDMPKRFAHHWRTPVTLFAMTLLASSAASAQDASLRVSVNGKLYNVSGNVVSIEEAGQQLDALTSRKASFAANVLDREILHSDFAARLFNPETRALVLSSVASGRLIEPWRHAVNQASTGPSSADLESATKDFKAWAIKLAGDPKQLMLAVVRKTYLDGVAAYQENAAIYRGVVNRNETLSYDDAARFLRNEMPTRRLAVAFEIEKYLNNAPAMLPPGEQEGSEEITKVRQRIKIEVLDKVGTRVKSLDELDRDYSRIARIAESDQATLRSYLGTVRPAIVRFTFSGSDKGGAAPQPTGGIVTRFGGQNAVTITVPVRSPVNPPVNIAGGILPPPSGITARAQANGSQASPTGPGNASGRNSAANTGSDNGAALGGGRATDTLASLDAGSRTPEKNSEPAVAAPGDIENLKTYSSEPYHSADGMVFNPLNGMWENPIDASDYRIPAVITCCDDTGLAFPDDALEAQQQYWWDGGGTSPNCGRLSSCGAAIYVAADPPSDPLNASGPADLDVEILRGIEHLDTLSADQDAFFEFIKGLPPAYWRRASLLIQRHHAARSGAPNAPNRATRSYSESNNGNRLSIVTGLGGSGAGVTSGYTQVTQSTAQAIVGQYKSIPGGVTLEGGSPDLAFIKEVSYLPTANAFLLNNDVVYLNPVTPQDFAEIYRAILTDDNMGVSLGQSAIVYGKLPPQGNVAVNLELVDHFLGNITFGSQDFVKGYIFAQNYVPKTLPPGTNTKPNAVYFNLHNVQFREEVDGHLARRGVNLDTTVVPLAAKEGSDGGHLPDLDRIKNGDIPPAYVANLKHLQDNISYYARERIVRRTLAFAEVAAFSRVLKAKRVTVDLASFNEGIVAERPIAPAPAATSGGEGCALAAMHWSSAESIGTREAYKDHLARFPTCTFATLAAARIAAIDAKTGTPPKH
jgi:hypothetical protein